MNVTNQSGGYKPICKKLQQTPKTWLVTGAAGFIGSSLVQRLLLLNQQVVGFDNFATGSKANLDDVLQVVSDQERNRFRFIEGDIRDGQALKRACNGVDLVLHQAALGSVPRSIADPMTSNDVNVGGFLQMLEAARSAGIQRIVYASSSSVYGDSPANPKQEDDLGQPLSPYAATKLMNEHYAQVYQRLHGIHCVGLRYFNVFGPRQQPDGPYAAVIPRWIVQLLRGVACEIFGDGTTSRDFCFVDNAVQANILAACTKELEPGFSVFNVSVGGETSLRELYSLLTSELKKVTGQSYPEEPVFRDFRAGDVKQSRAEIGRAESILGYHPTQGVEEGIKETVAWFAKHLGH